MERRTERLSPGTRRSDEDATGERRTGIGGEIGKLHVEPINSSWHFSFTRSQ